MTRIEAIRQLLKEAAKYPDGTLTFEAVCELIHLWDTRETALRALVDKADHLIRDVKADGRMTHQLRDLRDSLSRLLEQEP